MSTTLEMLIVPADPTEPCRLIPYTPATLDGLVTDQLGANRYNRTAVSVAGEHFHTVRAGSADGAPMNERVKAYVLGGDCPHLERFFRGDIAVTGRVHLGALGLCGHDEALALSPGTVEHFIPSAE